MPAKPTTVNRPIRTGDYRIRWAVVQYGNGYRISEQRMCIAERKWWIGWWPIADWRFDEAAAMRDIEHDRVLRAALPEPRIVA
jgi:hypothetical protein